LVVSDRDGKFYGFDVSTSKQEFYLLKAMAEDLLNSKRLVDSDSEVLDQALKYGSLEDIRDAIEGAKKRSNLSTFPAGRMLIVNVSESWRAGLGSQLSKETDSR
jgi:hypothetical protein